MRSSKDNLKFFEDMARVAGNAMNSMGDLKSHVKNLVNGFLSEMDIVTRDEFERVEAIAKKAREKETELEKRLAKLEAALGTKKAAKTKTAAPKRKKK